MFITGGNTNSREPAINQDFSRIMLLTGSVVSIVYQIPNQPLTFANETRTRYEDDLIAYSWTKFWNDANPNW
jgi:PhoPQ-activated pathogenicity-related protein